jgi:hypothetical protein
MINKVNPKFISRAYSYSTNCIKKAAGDVSAEISKASHKIGDFICNHDLIRNRGYGYSTYDAKELEIYSGSYRKDFGKSTEFGDYGGGYLLGKIEQPLSTAGIHDCAALNLIDEKSGKQFLYHVYAKSNETAIEKLINEKFPKYTRINIVPGDSEHTTKTVKKILNVLQNKNPECPAEFYYLPSKNAEVVAVNGDVNVIYHQGTAKPTFEVESNFNY